jgi:acyl-coenzyme A thioesterase PaaI-like protein
MGGSGSGLRPSGEKGARIGSVAAETKGGGGPVRRSLRNWLLKVMSFYPPFLGAGIRVVRISPDRRTFEVRMKLTFFNRNYVGTHFGGSLYAMCDPFFMLILIPALGPEYVVWDKGATIRFLRPGRGTVRATFDIPQERIEEIRRAADAGEKVEPVFKAEVVGEDGQVVVEVEKTLYVRRRRPEEASRPSS